MDSLDVELDGCLMASFNLDMYPDGCEEIIKDFCRHLKTNGKVRSWTVKRIFQS